MSGRVPRAIFTRDADTLDTFLANPEHRLLDAAKLVATREYLAVLAANDLLREGLAPEDLDYSLPTIVYGFFAMEPLLPLDLKLDLEEKADHLADALLCTFEPPTPPSPGPLSDAAAQAAHIFNRLARDFRASTYGSDLDE